MNKLLKQHRETLLALGAALLCLGAAFLVWLAVIRPNADKNLSEKISDDYTAATLLEEGDSVSQTFSTDSDLLALAFVFTVPGEQPSGTLELTLADADTGETLAASTGEMAKRYGFIFVNKFDDGTGDLSRERKDSFYWYQKIIATNGEDLR